MSCEICGRGSCTRSFHSLAAQERFDAVAQLAGDPLQTAEQLLDARDEIAHLTAEVERLRTAITDLHDAWSDAVQDDFECGVKSLSSREAQAFARKYPAINAIGGMIADAAEQVEVEKAFQSLRTGDAP